MSAPKKLDVVGRTVYRALLRRARRFDRDPELKALITRSIGDELPQPLDCVVAQFLGGVDRLHYWPKVGEPDSVVRATRDVFRNPPPEATLDGGFQGLRYLTGLLAVADKHQVVEHSRGLSPVAAATDEPQQSKPVETPQIRGQPEKGALLVSHPGLDGWFKRAAVLLCQHDPALGAYGLCLNKPLGGSVRELTDKLRELQDGGQGGNSTHWAQLVGALVGLVDMAPMQLKPPQLGLGQPAGPLDFPTLLLHTTAVAVASRQEDNEESDKELGIRSPEPGVLVVPWYTPLARVAKAAAAAASEPAAEQAASGAQGEQPSVLLRDVPEHVLRQRILELFSTAIEHEEQLGAEEEDDLGGEDDDEGYGDAGLGSNFDEGDDTDSSLDFLGSSESDGEDEPWGSGMESGGQPPTVVEFVLRDNGKGLRLARRFQQLAPEPAQATPSAPKSPALPASVVSLQKALQAVARRVAGQVLPSSQGAEAAASEQGGAPEQPLQQQQLQLQQQLPLPQQPEDGKQLERGGLPFQPSTTGSSCSQTSVCSSTGGSSTGGETADRDSLQAGAGRSSSEGDGSIEQPTSGGSGSSGGAPSSAGSAGTGLAADLTEGSKAPTVGQVLALFDGSQLFRGGPVEGLQLLHRRAELGGDAVIEPAGSAGGEEGAVFVGARLRDAPELARKGKLAPEDVKVFIGDCGWFGGQLERELAAGTWALVRADKQVLDLFHSAPQEPEQQQQQRQLGPTGGDLWQRLLSALGPGYAAMARIPEGAWREVRELQV